MSYVRPKLTASLTFQTPPLFWSLILPLSSLVPPPCPKSPSFPWQQPGINAYHLPLFAPSLSNHLLPNPPFLSFLNVSSHLYFLRSHAEFLNSVYFDNSSTTRPQAIAKSRGFSPTRKPTSPTPLSP